uniref:Peroxiredoxin n=1 Tax=Steinernema glaseri TaxID=37863 RepID=A0A1I8ADN9_9BILA
MSTLVTLTHERRIGNASLRAPE